VSERVRHDALRHARPHPDRLGVPAEHGRHRVEVEAPAGSRATEPGAQEDRGRPDRAAGQDDPAAAK